MPHQLRPELIPRVVERFKALSDESRLRLLLLLKSGPANVSELVRGSGIAQASVSKHLGVLKQAGLVECEPVANRCVYRIADATLFEMCEIVCEGVLRQAKAEHAALGLSAAARTRRKRGRS
jgi:DNA-binding transcriptional ArsR family regulator